MSTLHGDRQHVRDSAMRLIEARRQLHRQMFWLRDGFDRYRPAILIGSGFLAGVLLGCKSFVQASRSAFSIASIGFGMMRSSLGSMLIAATLRKAQASTDRQAAAPATRTRTDQG